MEILDFKLYCAVKMGYLIQTSEILSVCGYVSLCLASYMWVT